VSLVDVSVHGCSTPVKMPVGCDVRTRRDRRSLCRHLALYVANKQPQLISTVTTSFLLGLHNSAT